MSTERSQRPTDFWCNECRKWTTVEENGDSFWCKRCGEAYLCGECGYDIDRSGECQRSEGHSDNGEK